MSLGRKLDALVRAHAAQGTFSGAVLVARGSRVVLRRPYGLADAELGVPNRPEHAFRIGSVAKILTALAVLRFLEGARLPVRTSLGRFVPEFPDADLLSLHHLLSNTSGIADYFTLEDASVWWGRPHTLAELARRIAEAPRLFRPGERSGYSNANWTLLAAALERATERPFAEALTELVLEPLGLVHTTVAADSPLVAGSVSGYRLGDDGLRPAAHIDLSVEVGAGGVYSTVDDLFRLKDAFMRSDFLTPETRARMTTPVTTPVTDDAATGYGYGLMTGRRFGRAWLGHSGGTFGFSSFLTHYPDEDVTVIVLSNLEDGSSADLERDLTALTFGEPYRFPDALSERRAEAIVARDVLARYEGVYRVDYAGRPMNARVDLITDGPADGLTGYLQVKFPLLNAARLRTLSPTRFRTRLKGGEVTFEFVLEGERASGVSLNWSGTVLFAPKQEPPPPG